MSRLCQSWNFDETIFKGMKQNYEVSKQLNPKKTFQALVICDREKLVFKYDLSSSQSARDTLDQLENCHCCYRVFDIIQIPNGLQLCSELFFHILSNYPNRFWSKASRIPMNFFLVSLDFLASLWASTTLQEFWWKRIKWSQHFFSNTTDKSFVVPSHLFESCRPHSSLINQRLQL